MGSSASEKAARAGPVAEDAAAEDALIQQIRNGNRAAFGRLVSLNHSRIRAWLHYLARDQAAADDLAQQAFLQAWEKLSSFRGDTTERFSAWLSRIAYREFLQYVRRGKREASLFSGQLTSEGDPDHASDAAASGSSSVPDRVLDESVFPVNKNLAADSSGPADAGGITTLLKHCSVVQAQALYMNFVLELTHEEISSITGTPLGTVKSHISRGKAAIKSALTASAEFEPAQPKLPPSEEEAASFALSTATQKRTPGSKAEETYRVS